MAAEGTPITEKLATGALADSILQGWHADSHDIPGVLTLSPITALEDNRSQRTASLPLGPLDMIYNQRRIIWACGLEPLKSHARVSVTKNGIDPHISIVLFDGSSSEEDRREVALVKTGNGTSAEEIPGLSVVVDSYQWDIMTSLLTRAVKRLKDDPRINRVA